MNPGLPFPSAPSSKKLSSPRDRGNRSNSNKANPNPRAKLTAVNSTQFTKIELEGLAIEAALAQLFLLSSPT
jgi:hypothetical protein